jgi:N-acetylneuraminic acid mutarotase
MLSKRADAAAIGIDGKIYVFGGYVTNSKVTDSIEVYDPQSDSWSWVKTTLPLALKSLGVVEHDGLLFLLGGDTDTLANKPASNRIFTFDPRTGALAERKEKLPVAVSLYMSSSEYKGKIYISGGVLGGDLHKGNPNVYVFDPNAAQ